MARLIDFDLGREDRIIPSTCFSKRIGRFLAAALIYLSASACGIVEKHESYSCPEVFILKDAEKLTRFKPGPGRDNSDIRFEAMVSDFRGECDYNQDRGAWIAKVELLIQISVNRGVANPSGDIAFEYFVVLPDFEGKPGGKQIFSVNSAFEEGSKKRIYQDSVKLLIPLKTPKKGAQTEIVLGFQLTRDELKFNRNR